MNKEKRVDLSNEQTTSNLLVELLMENRQLHQELNTVGNRALEMLEDARKANQQVTRMEHEIARLQQLVNELAAERDDMIERSVRE